jgi:hypothetical protein
MCPTADQPTSSDGEMSATDDTLSDHRSAGWPWLTSNDSSGPAWRPVAPGATTRILMELTLAGTPIG